jgi:hypothetical protein
VKTKRKRIRWYQPKGKQAYARLGRCELRVGKAPGELAWFTVLDQLPANAKRGSIIGRRKYAGGTTRTKKLARAAAALAAYKIPACKTSLKPRRRRR